MQCTIGIKMWKAVAIVQSTNLQTLSLLTVTDSRNDHFSCRHNTRIPKGPPSLNEKGGKNAVSYVPLRSNHSWIILVLCD